MTFRIRIHLARRRPLVDFSIKILLVPSFFVKIRQGFNVCTTVFCLKNLQCLNLYYLGNTIYVPQSSKIKQSIIDMKPLFYLRTKAVTDAVKQFHKQHV